MAGSPTCGKMSTGIRCTASTAHSATAINATTTVKGLVRAAKTRRMILHSSAGFCREGPYISRRRRHAKQAAPHAEPCQRVVNLRLGQQALGFRYLVDIAQTSLVARSRLLQRCLRRRYLYRSVGRNSAGALCVRHRAIPLRAEIHCNLLLSGSLGADHGRLSGFPCPNGGPVKDRKRHAETECEVLNGGRQTVDTAQQPSIDFRACAASVSRALHVEPREPGAFEHPELGLGLFDRGALLHGNGIGCRVENLDLPLRWQLKQPRRGNSHLGGLHSNKLTEGCPRYVAGLLSLYELSSRGCQLRLCARRIRTWTQLSVHQRVDGLQDRSRPVHSCLRRLHGFLRGGQSQIGVRGYGRHFELGPLQRLLGLCPGSLRYGRVRTPQAEIKGSQLTSAPSALPQAVPELFVPSTGPEIEGMILCGNNNPKTLFRVARFTCANASTRGR